METDAAGTTGDASSSIETPSTGAEGDVEMTQQKDDGVLPAAGLSSRVSAPKPKTARKRLSARARGKRPARDDDESEARSSDEEAAPSPTKRQARGGKKKVNDDSDYAP